MPESRAGGYHGPVAGRVTAARLQRNHVFRLQGVDAPGQRFQVVQQLHGLQAELLRQRLGRYHPGQIGDAADALRDRTGHTEGRGLRL